MCEEDEVEKREGVQNLEAKCGAAYDMRLRNMTLFDEGRTDTKLSLEPSMCD